ncbi:hypothetical protein IJL65_04820 [bacterium]|nr:hypothetical protein [bacterium]
MAASSVDITKVTTLAAIMKNNAPTTKYNATLMKGNIILSYNCCAMTTHLGVASPVGNCPLIIPPFPTNHSAKNLAEVIIIIHNTPNITYLIPSFILSSELDVIILYPPKKAIAIPITIKTSIAYPIKAFTCSLNKAPHFSAVITFSLATLSYDQFCCHEGSLIVVLSTASYGVDASDASV